MMENQIILNTLPDGTVVIRWGGIEVSVIGELLEATAPESEKIDKIVLSTRDRLRSVTHDKVSVAIQAENFLPVTFLNTGIQKSLAICRVARYFSLSDFKNFIAKIEKALATSGNTDTNFATPEKVIEIFSIPEQVADEVFRLNTSDASVSVTSPLAVLKSITGNQLAKINPIPIGTGFLVGGSHLLTNHHVIPSMEIAEQCVAQFNYVESEQGDWRPPIEYEFDPRALFVSEPSLDYTLLQLK